VIVVMRTCFDQLQSYRFEEDLHRGRIVDIHEVLTRKGVRPTGRDGGALPVSRPMPQPSSHNPMEIVNNLLGTADGSRITRADRCAARRHVA